MIASYLSRYLVWAGIDSPNRDCIAVCVYSSVAAASNSAHLVPLPARPICGIIAQGEVRNAG